MFKLPYQIFLASIAASLLMSALFMMVLIAGLVGAELAPTNALATLPISFMVLGIALNAIPTSILIRRTGRKAAFYVALLLALLANVIAANALIQKSFSLWVFAAFLVGAYCSIGTQMRFIVVEYVKPENIPTALSVMMLGGVLAAFLGPEFGSSAANWFETPFVGSFVGISLIQVLGALLMFFVHKNKILKVKEHSTSVNNPKPINWKWMAIASSICAYGLMSYVMTATPISMHVHHGFDLESSKTVIQWHIFSMYLPAIFMGKLIEQLGEEKVLWLGIIAYVLTFTTTLSGISFSHFSVGLIFLGIGWNMMFTVGSTMVAKYDTDHKTQGLHDFCTYSVQGATTLLAGVVITRFGWQSVQITALIALVPYCILLFNWHRHQTLLKQHND